MATQDGIGCPVYRSPRDGKSRRAAEWPPGLRGVASGSDAPDCTESMQHDSHRKERANGNKCIITREKEIFFPNFQDTNFVLTLLVIPKLLF